MKNLISLFLIVISIFVGYSCSSEKENIEEYKTKEKAKIEFNGTTVFLQKIHEIRMNTTRTVQDEQFILAELVKYSSEYLKQNEFDYTVFFEDGDPRIAIVAMSLSKYDRLTSASINFRNRVVTRGVGGCVLEAIGIRSLLDGSIKRLGAKYAAKVISKKVLSRAVPYIGWGLATVDFANCMDWF